MFKRLMTAAAAIAAMGLVAVPAQAKKPHHAGALHGHPHHHSGIVHRRYVDYDRVPLPARPLVHGHWDHHRSLHDVYGHHWQHHDHARFHDYLDHHEFHRQLGHREAHRYAMTPHQHARLHDALDHDRFHDHLLHREYHRQQAAVHQPVPQLRRYGGFGIGITPYGLSIQLGR